MDIYTYRQDILVGGSIDLTGFDVEATDGHIGKVDEATYEAAASCLVVDTGFWIFGKKRPIPAAVIFNDWRRRAAPPRQRQRSQ